MRDLNLMREKLQEFMIVRDCSIHKLSLAIGIANSTLNEFLAGGDILRKTEKAIKEFIMKCDDDEPDLLYERDWREAVFVSESELAYRRRKKKK
ncbi:MAG: hypothetical protein ACRDL7_09745 [Gaiellaceae bacterium]